MLLIQKKKLNLRLKILYYIIKISQESENKIYFVLKKPSSLNLPKIYYSPKNVKNDYILDLKEN